MTHHTLPHRIYRSGNTPASALARCFSGYPREGDNRMSFRENMKFVALTCVKLLFSLLLLKPFECCILVGHL